MTDQSPGNMKKALSSQAQAVLDASTSVFWRPLIDVPTFHNKAIAAALRAAANQPMDIPVHVQDDGYWPYVNGIDAMRNCLDAIAAELEGNNA